VHDAELQVHRRLRLVAKEEEREEGGAEEREPEGRDPEPAPREPPEERLDRDLRRRLPGEPFEETAQPVITRHGKVT